MLIIYLATELNDVSANTAMYNNMSYTEGIQYIASTTKMSYGQAECFLKYDP